MNQRIGSPVKPGSPGGDPCRAVALRAFLLALMTVLPAAHAADAAPATRLPVAPVLSFEASAVVITGVKPNAQVIIFGIEREALGHVSRTVDVSVAVQSDPDGVARLDLERPLSPSSIYAAVDFETGGYAIATPDGMSLQTPPADAFRLNDLSADVEPAFETFDLDWQWVEAICVRPGQGAWRMSLMDGSSGDVNLIPGTTQMAAAQMQAMAEEDPALDQFRTNDVLIVIDPYEMQVLATAVNQ